MKLLIALLPLLFIQTASGFVRDSSTEIIFPQAVGFNVNLTIPATEISAASLTIVSDGREPITLDVDVEAASVVYGEPEARLIYVWHIPVDAPPPLFSEVSYRWSFESVDGDTGTLEDTFTFADPRTNWLRTVDPEDHFSITVPASLPTVSESLGEVYDLLVENTGRTPSYNLMVYSMSSGCTTDADGIRIAVSLEMGTTVPCDPGIEDAVFAGYQVIEVPSGASAEDLITAKLVREFYTPLWNGKAVPEWFLAGLEQLYSPTPKNPLLSPVQQAARAGTLLTLPEMELADESALWRAQSFGMMLYLFDQLGMRGVFDLARVDAEDFPTAYESAIDTPLTALIPAWSQWIFSRSAESLYGITPYQPPTPLPSPTLTPSTTRRPTLTPSPTFTPSLAATPTPRGVRTYTPPPTVTPSETLPPPPPTVTPRPPGSLQPLTPTPTALQVTLSQPGVQAGAITFLLLLLGLLVFVFIRLGNRR